MSTVDKSHCGCAANTDHDREIPEIDLLSPLTIRDITFKNRIGMSPMCQYCAVDGFASDWHLVHLGSRAAGGVALVMVEATAITAEGRISPGDLGIWDDKHIEPLKRIARFIESQGAVPGIQLAHAGRKGSCEPPWSGGARLKSVSEGGWTTIAPSAIPFNDDDPLPVEISLGKISEIKEAYRRAVQRALEAGFKVIEIHSAHGYLFHEFLSPLANQRKDTYGGSLDNRFRLLLETAEIIRDEMPKGLPLFTRISATDWVEGGWDIEQSVQLAEQLKKRGVDLIDVSSGGMVPKARIPVGKGYQVPFAKQIRDRTGIMTAAVGLITEVSHANQIITEGDADLIFLGRELLRDPYWAINAEQELSMEPNWPLQYGYAVKRRAK